MKIEVVKEFSFDAAHCLPEHAGKCKNLHGHTYKLMIGVTTLALNLNKGMVVDFGDLKKIVNELVIDKLDHSFLNNIYENEFPRNCPTAENMVVWIVKEIKGRLGYFGELSLVRLYETPTSYAEWRKKGKGNENEKCSEKKACVNKEELKEMLSIYEQIRLLFPGKEREGVDKNA